MLICRSGVWLLYIQSSWICFKVSFTWRGRTLDGYQNQTDCSIEAIGGLDHLIWLQMSLRKNGVEHAAKGRCDTRVHVIAIIEVAVFVGRHPEAEEEPEEKAGRRRGRRSDSCPPRLRASPSVTSQEHQLGSVRDVAITSPCIHGSLS